MLGSPEGTIRAACEYITLRERKIVLHKLLSETIAELQAEAHSRPVLDEEMTVVCY